MASFFASDSWWWHLGGQSQVSGWYLVSGIWYLMLMFSWVMLQAAREVCAMRRTIRG